MTIQISLDSLEVLLEEHQLKDETQEQTIYRLLAELKNNRELLKMANDNPRMFIYQSALSRLNRKDLSNLVKDLAVYCNLTVFEHNEEEATDAIMSIIEYLSNNWTKAQARELLFNLAIHCDMIPTYRKKADNDVHDYLTYVFAKYVCGYVPKNNSLIDLEGFANAFVQNYEKIQYTDNNTKIGDLFQPKQESTAKKPEQQQDQRP